MYKRLISALLALVSIVSLLSFGVLASEEPEQADMSFAEEALVPVLEEELPETVEDTALAQEDGSGEPVLPEDTVSEEAESAEEDAPIEGSGYVDFSEIGTDGTSWDLTDWFSDTEWNNVVTTIRTNMVARKTDTFEIAVKYQPQKGMNVSDTYSFMQEILQQALEEMIQDAMAHTGVPTEGDYLMWGISSGGGGYSFDSRNGDFDHVDDGNYVIVHLTFGFYYYTTAAQEKAITTKFNQVLSSLSLSGKTDYEKVCAIHNWICYNITYDKEIWSYKNSKGVTVYTAPPLSLTSYNALLNGKAVCQGYSVLFYRMCLANGIDCRVVAGECTNSENNTELHSWNIVKLGDRYYYVDATWDAAGKTAAQLSGDDSYVKTYLCKGYDYFMTTKNDHSLEDFSAEDEEDEDEDDGLIRTNYKALTNYDSQTKKWTDHGVNYLISTEDYDPSHKHVWNVTYAWSGYTGCTATRSCTCGKKEVCQASSITNAVTAEPTAGGNGTRTYTAVFSETWASAQKKTQAIKWVLGDLNNTGKVDAQDLVSFAKYIAGDSTAITNVAKARVSGGTEVTLIDLVKAMKAAAGL